MIYKILHSKLKIEQREHNYAQIMSISSHVRCHSSIDQSAIIIINVERLYDIVNRRFPDTTQDRLSIVVRWYLIVRQRRINTQIKQIDVQTS